MNQLENFLWLSTILFEVVLCGFVSARKVQQILPLFAVYAWVLLTGSIGLWLVDEYIGFTSPIAVHAYWVNVLVNAFVRSFAIAELCRYGLRNYRGIWALVWRALVAISALFLAHAALDARGQPNGIAIYGTTLDRDLALASIAILTVLFLIRKYYGLALDPLQRLIAAGICFSCVVDVIGNTILRGVFTGYLFGWFLTSQKALWPVLEPQVQRLDDIFSTFHLFAFMFSMGIWCYALRRPVNALSEIPALLPAEVYREISPAINMRLNTFNNRLVELLKP
jgi:hypothetical protein